MKKKKSKKEDNMLEVLFKITFISSIILIIIGVGYFRMTLQWGDGLLSYVGAIIGGGLTLIGVAITIYYQDVRRKEGQEQHEREKREEFERRDKETKNNLSSQYKPILTISFDEEFIDDNSFGITNYEGFITQNNLTLVNDSIDKERHNIVFHFSIFNIGRGEAINLKINPFLISLSDTDNMQTVHRWYSELYALNKLDIAFSMEISKNTWKQYNNENYVNNNPIFMLITVEYTDLVDQKYMLQTDIAIKGLTSRESEDNKKIPNKLFLNPYDTIIYNETKRII